MTDQPLLDPEIPHGIRTESAWKECGSRARRARMCAPAIPYPTRTGTRLRSFVPSALVPPIRAARCARDFPFVKKTHTKTLASTIARIVHGLLAEESFESLADLTDAVKWRLAQLRIRWTPDDLNTAYRLVATARSLPGRRPV